LPVDRRQRTGSRFSGVRSTGIYILLTTHTLTRRRALKIILSSATFRTFLRRGSRILQRRVSNPSERDTGDRAGRDLAVTLPQKTFAFVFLISKW